jgi:hypothetical protein
MYTFLCHIHPPTPFPQYLSPPTGASPPHWQYLFHHPVLQFSRKKKEREKRKWKTWHFSLFEVKVATWGISLWYFYMYMYYNPNWFISSNFLHSTLVPFLW